MDEDLAIGQQPGNGRSQKKRQRKYEEKRKQLYAAIALVNLIYFGVPYMSDNTDVEFPMKTFAFHWVATFALTRLILNSVLSGYDYEYYFDLLAINLVTQALSTYSDKAYYLFWLPPLYILFLLCRRVVRWVFTPTAEELANNNKIQTANTQQQPKKKQKRMVR